MSGHSKWATTKHKKMAIDAKRGKIFTKVLKEITVAARIGGGDPAGNPRLRAVILKAKEANTPADNIKKAIQKGTGELPGVTYEEAVFEGYGPGGTALLISIMTDNKNRTVPEIRHLLSKHGGNMGEAGCVSWMFDKKGVIVFDREGMDEEKLMEAALECGADDLQGDESQFEVLTDPVLFFEVKEALEARGYKPLLAEVQLHPKSTVHIEEEKAAQQVLKLVELLEDHDDVNDVFANFDIPDELLEALM